MLNIAVAIDRHAVGESRDHIAIRWLGEDGTRRDLSYAKLKAETNRFANVLRCSRRRQKATACSCVLGAFRSFTSRRLGL